MSTKRDMNWRSLANFFAYISIIFIGAALLIGKLFGSTDIGGALMYVAQVLAYIIVGCISFFYARSKRNFIYLVLWIVAVVLIVVSFFL